MSHIRHVFGTVSRLWAGREGGQAAALPTIVGSNSVWRCRSSGWWWWGVDTQEWTAGGEGSRLVGEQMSESEGQLARSLTLLAGMMARPLATCGGSDISSAGGPIWWSVRGGGGGREPPHL